MPLTFALLVGTDVAVAAVAVHLALERHLGALPQGVARVARQTGALGLVLFRAAHRVDAAHAADVARRLAEAVDARLVLRAAVVCAASDCKRKSFVLSKRLQCLKTM